MADSNQLLFKQLGDLIKEGRLQGTIPREWEFEGEWELEEGKKRNKARLEEDLNKAPEKRLAGTRLKEIRAVVETRRNMVLLGMSKEPTRSELLRYQACKKALELMEKIVRCDQEIKDLPNFPGNRGAKLSIALQKHEYQKSLLPLLKAIFNKAD
jgi:hypothetical protein